MKPLISSDPSHLDDIFKFKGSVEEKTITIKQKITDQTPSYELVFAKNAFTFDPRDYKKEEIGSLNEGIEKLKKISEHI